MLGVTGEEERSASEAGSYRAGSGRASPALYKTENICVPSPGEYFRFLARRLSVNLIQLFAGTALV